MLGYTGVSFIRSADVIPAKLIAEDICGWWLALCRIPTYTVGLATLVNSPVCLATDETTQTGQRVDYGPAPPRPRSAKFCRDGTHFRFIGPGFSCVKCAESYWTASYLLQGTKQKLMKTKSKSMATLSVYNDYARLISIYIARITFLHFYLWKQLIQQT